MIWLFLVCLVVLVSLLEQCTAEWAMDHLQYSCSCDKPLVEPDEVLTLTTSLENHWYLPILYVRLTKHLPQDATLMQSENWTAPQPHAASSDVNTEEITCLFPHRRQISQMQFSLPCRGWHHLGTATLLTGDFLGLNETSQRLIPLCGVSVIPRRCESPDVLRTLGGFLGNISVRRFILEDPILTIGVREYTGREPMKSISWPHSARSGQLLVKQYDYTVEATATVLLNVEGGHWEQLEQCYSMVRTVCEELENKGIPYDFRSNGDLIGPMGLVTHVGEGLGHQHLQTILYSLGRANYRCKHPLSQMIRRSLRSARPNQSYLVVTPPPSPDQQQLIDQLKIASGSPVCVLVCEEVTA